MESKKDTGLQGDPFNTASVMSVSSVARSVAGVLLVGMSGWLLFSGHDSALLAPPEPVLAISSQWVLWGIGVISGVIGAICLFARREQLPVSLVAWFCFSLLIYRAGYFLLGVTDAQAYVGKAASDYGLSARSFLVILTSVVVGLGLWSWGTLAWFLFRKTPARVGLGPAHTPEHNPAAAADAK